MSLVCGIDPSLTSAGVAILRDGQPVHVGHHGYSGHNGASWQQRSRRVRWTCGQIMDAIGLAVAPVQTAGELIPHDWSLVDLAVIEGPSYGSHHGSVFDRAGLWHGIFGALDARKIPIAVVAPQTRAKWATGKARAEKRDVLAAAQEWFPQVANDDQADAAWLALMGAVQLGCYPPVALTEWRINGLKAVAWP